MYFKLKQRIKFLAMLICLGFLSYSSSHAQQDRTILTVTLLEQQNIQLGSSFFREFEEEYNVLVQVRVINYDDTPALLSNHSIQGMDVYFDILREYVSMADVIYIYDDIMQPAAIEAGYFLNLAPLVATDNNINNLNPLALNTYKWNNGIWGIPSRLDARLLSYDRQAFDDLGLSYPNPSWDIHDFEQAIRSLATEFPDRLIIQDSSLSLLRSFSHDNFYDSNVIPHLPHFSDFEFIDLIQEWTQVLSIASSFASQPQHMERAIISVNSVAGFLEHNRGYTLLPNNYLSYHGQGFAVSSGTNYPDLSYKLIRYLIEQPQLNLSSDSSLLMSNTLNMSLNVGVNFLDDYLDDNIQTQHAIPLMHSGLYFTDYIWSAILSIIHSEASNSLDIGQTLMFFQAEAQTLLNHAIERSLIDQIAVDLPSPIITDQTQTLNFGVVTQAIPLLNGIVWEQVVNSFAESEIGEYINLIPLAPGNILDETMDCIYLPSASFITLYEDSFLDISPLIASDPLITSTTFIANSLNEMDRQNSLVGYPFNMYPRVIFYDANALSSNNIPLPVNGWTMSDFLSALNILDDSANYGRPSFAPAYYDSTYLLMLIIANGGLPVDFRTEPYHVDLIGNIEEIRQILDLARDEIISYRPLIPRSSIVDLSSSALPILAPDIFYSNSYYLNITDNYDMTMYPVGDFAPVGYDVSSLHILKSSQKIQECYAWFSYLSTVSHLFDGIPLSSVSLEQVSVEIQHLAMKFDELLRLPQTILVPNTLVPELRWLFQAFDNYILDGSDLEVELTNAEYLIETYRNCLNDDFERHQQECLEQVEAID